MIMRAFIAYRLQLLLFLLLFITSYRYIDANESKNYLNSCKKKAKSSINEMNLLLPFQSNHIYLTISQTPNGMGVYAHHLLYAASYAFYRKWNFGGLIIDSVSNSHFVSGNLFSDFLFGNHEKVIFNKIMAHANHSNAIHRITNYTVTNICIDGNDFYVKLHFNNNLHPIWTPDNGTIIHLPNIDNFFLEKIVNPSSSSSPSTLYPIDTFLTKEFLTLFRQQASCGVKTILKRRRNYFTESDSNYLLNTSHQCNSRIIHVAAHLRRGDSHRGPSLSYYFFVIRSLVVLFPTCLSVHFFVEDMPVTELKSIETQVEAISNTMIVNNTFFIHNYVSLWQRDPKLADGDADLVSDDETTLETLTHIAHFITADIFIASFSSFSFFAALYNPRCVVHAMPGDKDQLTSMYLLHQPLSSWIVVSNYSNEVYIQKVLSNQIPLCISQ